MLLPSNHTTRVYVPEDLPNTSFKSPSVFRMHRVTCVDHLTWISKATTDVCVQAYVLRGFLYSHFLQAVNLICLLCWFETRIFLDFVSVPWCDREQPTFFVYLYLCRKTENWPSLLWQLLHTSYERNNMMHCAAWINCFKVASVHVIEVER